MCVNDTRSIIVNAPERVAGRTVATSRSSEIETASRQFPSTYTELDMLIHLIVALTAISIVVCHVGGGGGVFGQ